jgi:hypothetical protein
MKPLTPVAFRAEKGKLLRDGFTKAGDMLHAAGRRFPAYA